MRTRATSRSCDRPSAPVGDEAGAQEGECLVLPEERLTHLGAEEVEHRRGQRRLFGGDRVRRDRGVEVEGERGRGGLGDAARWRRRTAGADPPRGPAARPPARCRGRRSPGSSRPRRRPGRPPRPRRAERPAGCQGRRSPRRRPACSTSTWSGPGRARSAPGRRDGRPRARSGAVPRPPPSARPDGRPARDARSSCAGRRSPRARSRHRSRGRRRNRASTQCAHRVSPCQRPVAPDDEGPRVCGGLLEVVAPTGVDPVTLRFSVVRSTN